MASRNPISADIKPPIGANRVANKAAFTDDELQDLAAKLRPNAYVYFRHEDEPTAPVYAERLLELLGGRPPA